MAIKFLGGEGALGADAAPPMRPAKRNNVTHLPADRPPLGLVAFQASATVAAELPGSLAAPPLARNTAMLTSPVGPWRVASGLPSRSHSRAVLSSEAVRMRPPSGANTALLTAPVWTWRGASGLPSARREASLRFLARLDRRTQ